MASEICMLDRMSCRFDPNRATMHLCKFLGDDSRDSLKSNGPRRWYFEGRETHKECQKADSWTLSRHRNDVNEKKSFFLNGCFLSTRPLGKGLFMTVKTGTRRMDEHLARAIHYAESFKPNCSKGQALAAVKKARIGLGLSLADLYVLDSLFAASQPQDWDEGQRPIVWPSNDELCEMTGLSLTSLRRHIRTLIRTGLIAPKDSPTGQRYGRRCAEGLIVKAYGFDLTPIATRYHEIRQIGSEALEKKSARREMQSEFTILRRNVRRIIQSGEECGLVGEWKSIGDELDALINEKNDRSPLPALILRLRNLNERAEEIYKKAHNIEPLGADCGTDILTTTNLNFSKCSENRSAAKASQLNSQSAFGAEGSSSEPARGSRDEQPDNAAQSGYVTPFFVVQACPNFSSYGSRPKTWKDVIAIAEKLRPGLGISESAWIDAQNTMGQEQAAASIAIIMEKRTSGEIRSSGGYLRGMTNNSRAGALNIAKSLYGLTRG